MIDDALTGLADSPAVLPLLFALVLGDAFLVILPGEAAVTALAALAVSQGAPSLAGVVLVAASAALCGDVLCYALGRRVGLDRWTWMRRPRVTAAFAWARDRLDRRTASVLFTARFIPFARLAVNLTAGAGRMPVRRHLPFAAGAALVWALYQAFVGALVGQLLPGAPVPAVVVSVVVALALGALLDAVLTRRARTRGAVRSPWKGVPMTETYGPGYDPGFLGSPLPLPMPAADVPVEVLPYLHFSVVLQTARRLACVTGVNIDGASLEDLPRTGDWEYDPRVHADAQCGPEVYARNDLDRGHLVRRRDPGWGDESTAREATEQTFFFTNAAPQASGFNQSPDLWLGLEDHVLAYAGANRLRVSVFTAPMLEDDDPLYRGVRLPRRFWKIAAWATDGPGSPLAAAGFVLDQSRLIDTGEERAVAPLAGFRTFQAPITDIAAEAGIDVGLLAEADVLALVPASRPGASWRELDDPADIRLSR